MQKLRVLDLFSGVGGFSLGLERTGGFETVAFCEIEKFPQKVLKKHWPEIPIYEDVKEIKYADTDTTRMEKSWAGETTQRSSEGWRAQQGRGRTDGGWITGTTTDGENRTVGPIDVITGGFPCQDISVAGKQAGIRDGERSSLFDEIIRLTRDIRPSYVICENVAALLSGSRGEWFSYVLCEFSRIGYDVEWESISAQEVGAWHKRDRVWIIAYPNDSGHASSEGRIDRYRQAEVQERQQPQPESSRQGYDVPNARRELRSERDSARMETDKTIRVASQLYTKSSSEGQLSDTMQQRLQGGENTRSLEGSWQNIDKLIARCSESLSMWESEPELGRVADGIPDRSHRLKGLGNAVVPQIPELIGRAILEAER